MGIHSEISDWLTLSEAERRDGRMFYCLSYSIFQGHSQGLEDTGGTFVDGSTGTGTKILLWPEILVDKIVNALPLNKMTIYPWVDAACWRLFKSLSWVQGIQIYKHAVDFDFGCSNQVVFWIGLIVDYPNKVKPVVSPSTFVTPKLYVHPISKHQNGTRSRDFDANALLSLCPIFWMKLSSGIVPGSGNKFGQQWIDRLSPSLSL